MPLLGDMKIAIYSWRRWCEFRTWTFPFLTSIADIEEIPELIDQLQVQDVLITLGPNQNNELMEILTGLRR